MASADASTYACIRSSRLATDHDRRCSRPLQVRNAWPARCTAATNASPVRPPTRLQTPPVHPPPTPPTWASMDAGASKLTGNCDDRWETDHDPEDDGDCEELRIRCSRLRRRRPSLSCSTGEFFHVVARSIIHARGYPNAGGTDARSGQHECDYTLGGRCCPSACLVDRSPVVVALLLPGSFTRSARL